MEFLKAVITEKGSNQEGKVILDTKSCIRYRSLTKDQFKSEVLKLTCFTFEIFEFK